MTTVLAPDEDICQWSVEAVAERVLTPDEVSRSSSLSERLAAESDGDCDGWEAAV